MIRNKIKEGPTLSEHITTDDVIADNGLGTQNEQAVNMVVVSSSDILG